MLQFNYNYLIVIVIKPSITITNVINSKSDVHLHITTYTVDTQDNHMYNTCSYTDLHICEILQIIDSQN